MIKRTVLSDTLVKIEYDRPLEPIVRAQAFAGSLTAGNTGTTADLGGARTFDRVEDCDQLTTSRGPGPRVPARTLRDDGQWHVVHQGNVYGIIYAKHFPAVTVPGSALSSTPPSPSSTSFRREVVRGRGGLRLRQIIFWTAAASAARHRFSARDKRSAATDPNLAVVGADAASLRSLLLLGLRYPLRLPPHSEARSPARLSSGWPQPSQRLKPVEPRQPCFVGRLGAEPTSLPRAVPRIATAFCSLAPCRPR
ncbi:MAG: hypothetical protein U1G05_13020 [Kiritimatiellia bacterium]